MTNDKGGPESSPAMERTHEQRQRRIAPLVAGIVVMLVAIAGLYWVFESQAASGPMRPSGSKGDAGASGYKYAVGDPEPGEPAPEFNLSSSEGGRLALSDLRGETVLLYFQGGLMCQPCFDQITDLENNADALHEAGIDRMVAISHDPVDLLSRKGADMGLSTPLLSDPDMEAIRDYDANSYGMMGGSAAGHSFVFVDAGGAIIWRADYGGAPDYTMFLPAEAILADLEADQTS